jgi:hypothetical protein
MIQLAIIIFDITAGAVSFAVHCQSLQKHHCQSEDTATVGVGLGLGRFKSVIGLGLGRFKSAMFEKGPAPIMDQTRERAHGVHTIVSCHALADGRARECLDASDQRTTIPISEK